MKSPAATPDRDAAKVDAMIVAMFWYSVSNMEQSHPK
jgi:hypothetical protein